MCNEINRDVITVEDCIDMAEKKNMYAVINDGKVIDFVEEGDLSHATI